MSAKRVNVPSDEEGGEGKAAQSGRARPGLRRPFVPGAQAPPGKPATEPGGEETEPVTGGAHYIDINLEELIPPGEVPSVLADASPTATPTAEKPGSDASLLYGVAEELVRMRRQLELRSADSRTLAELQSEADSPAMRELIEAAFAAGYFAAKGELERRLGRTR